MTKKELVYKILNEKGYILDQDSVKIWNDESGVYKVTPYVSQWQKLQADKRFCEGKKIIKKDNFRGKYFIGFEGMNDGTMYKIGKEFYNQVSI